MDIFDFAMEKEKEAEKLYRELAERSKEEGVKKILLMLADDEAKHFEIVKRMKEEHPEMAAEIDQRLRAVLLPKAGDDADPIDSEATDFNPEVEPATVEVS